MSASDYGDTGLNSGHIIYDLWCTK